MNKPELEYIKAGGKYYRPQEAGVKNTTKLFSNYPICLIKKLRFGRWRIDFFDKMIQYSKFGGYMFGDEDKPNTTIFLYPAGIEEIVYSQANR